MAFEKNSFFFFQNNPKTKENAEFTPVEKNGYTPRKHSNSNWLLHSMTSLDKKTSILILF